MQYKCTQNELDIMKYLKLLNIIIFLFSFEVGGTPKCLYKFYSEYLKKKKSFETERRCGKSNYYLFLDLSNN